MRKKIFHNWGLKLISLLLASLLWILVVQMGDPPNEKDMGNIQVKLTNTDLLERENKVYEILDNTDTVRITVNAPRSVFERLRNSDITAEADVSRLTDINTVPIKFSTSIANVLSIEGNHEVVKLNVEDRVSKYVALVSATVGEVAEGYVMTGITPDQNRIEVSGPKSVVERVKYARVELDVTDATGNLTANVDIGLYDAEDNPVENANLKKNVNYVRMSVEVLSKKDVPVELEVAGNPARGYMFTGVVESNPAVVSIAGTSAALQRVSSIRIPAEKLDITDESGDVETVIDIREFLPDNVKFADSEFNGKIDVTIHIEPVVEKTLYIPMNNVEVTNLPDGFAAEVHEPEDEVYVLEVEGLDEQIAMLYQDAVTGYIDIAAWMEAGRRDLLKAGTYNIPITFDLDEQIIIKKTLNARVTVREDDTA